MNSSMVGCHHPRPPAVVGDVLARLQLRASVDPLMGPTMGPHRMRLGAVQVFPECAPHQLGNTDPFNAGSNFSLLAKCGV